VDSHQQQQYQQQQYKQQQYKQQQPYQQQQYKQQQPYKQQQYKQQQPYQQDQYKQQQPYKQQQQNILITRDDFLKYLKKMAELISRYGTLGQGFDAVLSDYIDADYIQNNIVKLLNTDKINNRTTDLTINKLLDFLKIVRERIGLLSHNMFTQSAERIKIYTNLYTVIFTPLNILNGTF
jgi:hypothetical protein